MQTRFSPAQLQDASTREMELILRKCVHCGFCTATCPTYVLLGDELDSPRGRIWLIKDMLENDRDATAEVVTHLDRCLSCLACMTTCPSGVNYQHLIDHARAHVERTYRRPWRERFLRRFLLSVLPYPARFRVALWTANRLRGYAARWPSAMSGWLELLPARLPGERVERATTDAGDGMAATAPMKARRETPTQMPIKAPTPMTSQPRRRVALLEGCVESVLAPQIHAAATRVLNAAGAEVVSVAGCCGALPHHLGDTARTHRLGVDLIGRLDGATEGFELLATTASGCGTHLKDYGHVLHDDADARDAAQRVATKARDITEVLLELGVPSPKRAGLVTVAYHSACSLQHGQHVERAPRELLARAGFRVFEIAEGHLCCGSAGTYNLLQPALATRLRDRKLERISATGADVIATGNIGCITQLAAAANRPVVHTVELLDWALGGPLPAALRTAMPQRLSDAL